MDTIQEKESNISLEYKRSNDKGAKVFKKGVIVKNNFRFNGNNNGDEDDLKGEINNNNNGENDIITEKIDAVENTVNGSSDLSSIQMPPSEQNIRGGSKKSVQKLQTIQDIQDLRADTNDVNNGQESPTGTFSSSSSDDKVDFESRTSKSSFSSISINQQTDTSTDKEIDSFVHLETKRASVTSFADNPEFNDISLENDNYVHESSKEWGSQEWSFPKAPNSLKNFPSLFSSKLNASSTINTPIIDRPDSRMSTTSTVSNYDLLIAKLEREDQILQEDPKAKRISLEGIEELKRSFERVQNEANANVQDDDIDWEFWGEIISDYENVARTQSRKLTKSIQKGIPQALRGMIWQLMSKSKDAILEADYAQLLKESSPHEKMIIRDLSRTFPKHEFFQNQDGIGQEGLFNVVKAYSVYDPEVGYCQGISFVVGPLLLNMPDEEAFCVLVKLMKHYNMRGHFLPGMDGLQLRLFQFDRLVEEMLPKVHNHLLAQGINSSMYASQWFMTLFAYKFPLPLVFRIYDTIFAEGIEAIFRFSIALLKKNEKRIVELDFEPLLEFLKSGLFESYQSTPTGVLVQLISETQYKTNEFAKDAYDVRITVKTLNKYQQAYYTHQENEKRRLIVEAESAERMRINNAHLSNKIKSLESALETLDREHIELANDYVNTKMELAQCRDENDNLHQMVIDLRRGLVAQPEEIESKLQEQMEDLAKKNVELVGKNKLLEDQLANLENMLIEFKMRYAESENERERLKQKWSDLKRALE